MTDHSAGLSFEEQADILERVTSLATTFSTCVEAFGLIHPTRQTDPSQKLALTRLGIEQSRLLIWGDAVGISSPPRSIATHMIPSRPGALNPDPNEPVNFGERDPRLDDPEVRQKVENTLNEILERPVTLSREAMMEQYGMTSPKKPIPFEPSLDTTRVAAFREKFGLLHDLSGPYVAARRGQSMTTQHWLTSNVAKFESFVQMVRAQVNTLITLFTLDDRIDRGMKIDIKALGWHPDVSGPIVRRDWEKLRLIAEACKHDYPQYLEPTETALEFLNRTWRDAHQPAPVLPQPSPAKSTPKDPPGVAPIILVPATEKKNHRPAWLKALLGKKHKSDSKTLARTSAPAHPRSKSVDVSSPLLVSPLEHTRSKSLSTIPSRDTPLPGIHPADAVSEIADPGAAAVAALTSRDPLAHQPPPSQARDAPSSQAHSPLSPPQPAHADPALNGSVPSKIDSPQISSAPDGVFPGLLAKVETYNSMVERHDQYAGLGRTETRDQRAIAHGWHN